jgi:hypothetical protein
MQRSEIRAPAVLAIVLVSYTMIVLDISIVITAPSLRSCARRQRVGTATN